MSSFFVDSPRSPPWWRVDGDGSITLAIHVQPGAKRSEVVGVHGDSLKIRLAARAIEGNANAALKVFLADAFAVSAGAVTLIRGAKSRRKIMCVAAPWRRPNWGWESSTKT